MMNEELFATELEDGTEVPVREVGTKYVVAYDHMDPYLFLGHVSALLGDEETSDWTEKDVIWGRVKDISFDINPQLIPADEDDFRATYVTILQRWW